MDNQPTKTLDRVQSVLDAAHSTTKHDDPLVHIAWLIQGLDLGNYTLEQTQRYVISQVMTLLDETVQRNRIELASDIKRRHWVNDSLRDAYLNAVIEASKERLAGTDK